MFDSHSSANVTVQKPDLFSVAVQRGDLPMNGCRFCKRTIFFNGATWQHKNDRNECEDVPCKLVPLGGKKVVQYEVVVGFWSGKKEIRTYEADTFICQRCDEEGFRCLEPNSIFYDDILDKNGRMMNSTYRKCPGAVGTPAVS